MNIIIWARVSSREQREGYSIDAQLRLTRERAEKNGWTIVREFAVAESAKRGAERLAFNEMFTWVRKNARKDKIKAILAHKLDRVCRNMRDAVRLQELEDACGVELAFVDNQFGPGAAGALSFNVMAAVAQYYSDNLRTEVLKGMEEKIRQGWPMGRASFGYQHTSDRACPIVPHPENAATVVRLFELYSTGKHTLFQLIDQMAKEGRIFRQTMPRFNRTAISYILNNRAYIGEIERKGTVYPAKFQPLVSRATFETCQELLKGKNRRIGNPEIAYSGGIFRCKHCGSAMTGERIQRKLTDGSVNIHVYYKCGNNQQEPGHPLVRWREGVLEEAVINELDSMRIPNQEVARWMREAISAAFADAAHADAMRRKVLTKRQSEVKGMLDRLLNAYLEGLVEEPDFKAKQAGLKRELAEVGQQLDDDSAWDPKRGELALAAFDFSQQAGQIWRRSNWAVRREILTAVSSNRHVDVVTLCLDKRKPFDAFTEGPLTSFGRGDRI